jgi:hypothetical protein
MISCTIYNDRRTVPLGKQLLLTIEREMFEEEINNKKHHKRCALSVP